MLSKSSDEIDLSALSNITSLIDDVIAKLVLI
jgi:hypothetical protein